MYDRTDLNKNINTTIMSPYLKTRASVGFITHRNGQFMIIASLLIAILILGLSVGVNEMGLRKQELRYKPLKEVILSITRDAHRALTAALRNGTQVYNESFWSEDFPRNHEEASAKAYQEIEDFMSIWTRSVLTSYSSLGAQLKIPFRDIDYFEKNINWGSWGSGISSVEMQWSLNLTSEGFSGWEGLSVCTFILEAHIYASEGETVNKFDFFLIKYMGELGMLETPIHDLRKEDLRISQFINGKWNDTKISELKYLGDGTYEVVLEKELYYGKRVNILVQVPGDKVLVGVSLIIGELPPWNTLFFESPYYLSPKFSYHSPSHLIQPFSHGKGKSDIKMWTRLRTPSDIALGDHVVAFISLRRNPRKAEIEWVWLRMGFNYSTTSYEIAKKMYYSSEFGGTSNLISAFRDGVRLNISRNASDYPSGYFNETSNTGIIPKNSTIWLLVSVQLVQTPYGTTMAECGVRFNSRIELREFEPPEINIISVSYNKETRYLNVIAIVTDIGHGDSAIASAILRLNYSNHLEKYNMECVAGEFYKDSTVKVECKIRRDQWEPGDYIIVIEGYDIFGNPGEGEPYQITINDNY
ncbi:MAG: hypothetical protein QXI39_01060 [Candidatus Bathyarchaeia archaeon]